MFKKYKIVGDCVDLSFEGRGVVKTLYGVVFVDGLFPGEKAEIEIQYKKAGNFFGKVIRLFEKSPHRIQPRCPVCTSCGGCQFQQLSYETQLVYKQERVKRALEKMLCKEIVVLPTIGMDDPYHYRNKIQVPIGLDSHGHIVSGFYRADSHRLIPVDGCAIEDERATEILRVLKKLFVSFKYRPYDEDSGTGLIRHCLIRTSKYRNEIMVVLVTTRDEFVGKNNFIKELIAKCPQITTIVQNINSRHTNVILGEKERILYGPGFIVDEIMGLKFRISSKSFYQVNPIQVQKLYDIAISNAIIKKTDVVFDAYCGTGTIGLLAAKYAKEVIGVEIVKEAVNDAKNNAKANGVNNAKFFCEDAGEFIVQLASENKVFDCVFIDPPRKGASEQFISSLLMSQPKRIVYVSCDPDTLARDISMLSEKYKIENVRPVDMFPMTHHVETVVVLSKR